ncbi:MAG: DUF2628 domain-containing protein [Rhodospirillales bacterium]|nr:DUF2628 domain-containing protein [Rhodospirillales bacterium]
MKVFTVHYRRLLGKEPDLVLVKEGFSWPAFIFSLFWALWNQLWLVSLGLIGIQVLLNLILNTLNFGYGVQTAFSVALALFIGVFGNDLRRWTLKNRCGFDELGVVTGEKISDGEQRFLANRPDVLMEFS